MIKIKCQRKHNVIYVVVVSHLRTHTDSHTHTHTDGAGTANKPISSHSKFISGCWMLRETEDTFRLLSTEARTRCNLHSPPEWFASRPPSLNSGNVQTLLTNKLMGIYRFAFLGIAAPDIDQSLPVHGHCRTERSLFSDFVFNSKFPIHKNSISISNHWWTRRAHFPHSALNCTKRSKVLIDMRRYNYGTFEW